MVGTGSFIVVAKGAHNWTRGRAIKDPTNALREGREEIGGVDPSIEASNAACTRFIKGYGIPYISSRSPNRNDRVESSSGGMDISGILYLPSNFWIIPGLGGASRSTIICTIGFIRQEILGVVG